MTKWKKLMRDMACAGCRGGKVKPQEGYKAACSYFC